LDSKVFNYQLKNDQIRFYLYRYTVS
jgi:hypothetical protein